MDTDKMADDLAKRCSGEFGHALDKINLSLGLALAVIIILMMWHANGEKADRITYLEKELGLARAALFTQTIPEKTHDK